MKFSVEFEAVEILATFKNGQAETIEFIDARGRVVELKSRTSDFLLVGRSPDVPGKKTTSR